ncbi:MAG: TonB-dependent receptor [Colwellia sp.]|nr:TonB-dependent receptor [Colwellia sp.]
MLKAAVAIFYMDYEDLQQTLSILESETGLALPSVKNAANASIAGTEIEFDWRATEQLRLSLSGVWLDATYDLLLSNDILYPELGQRDYSGNRLVRAPKWQFNTGAEYSIPLVGEWLLIMRVDYAWQDKVYYDYFNNDAVSQDSYCLLNLTASIETMDARWQFLIFVRNTRNELYLNHAHDVNGAPQQLTGTVVQDLAIIYELNNKFKQ